MQAECRPYVKCSVIVEGVGGSDVEDRDSAVVRPNKRPHLPVAVRHKVDGRYQRITAVSGLQLIKLL